MFYEQIFRQFNQEDIKYVVIGGIAVNLHGVPRTTQDLDIIVSLSKNNITKLINKLIDLNYKPRLPVDPFLLTCPKQRKDWIETKNLKAFTFQHREHLALEVDILISGPITFSQTYKNRIIKLADDLRLPIASIQDLILLKEPIGRKQDISDIAMLRKIQELDK